MMLQNQIHVSGNMAEYSEGSKAFPNPSVYVGIVRFFLKMSLSTNANNSDQTKLNQIKDTHV